MSSPQTRQATCDGRKDRRATCCSEIYRKDHIAIAFRHLFQYSTNRLIANFNHQAGSRVEDQVVELLTDQGNHGSTIIFKEAIMKLTGSTQWLDKYPFNW